MAFTEQGVAILSGVFNIFKVRQLILGKPAIHHWLHQEIKSELGLTVAGQHMNMYPAFLARGNVPVP